MGRIGFLKPYCDKSYDFLRVNDDWRSEKLSDSERYTLLLNTHKINIFDILYRFIFTLKLQFSSVNIYLFTWLKLKKIKIINHVLKLQFQ